MATTTPLSTWDDWRAEREAAVTAPDGPAALTGTTGSP
jgi:hypothetical protein